LFEAIFNTIHEGILVISVDGTIEYANAAAANLIGLREEDWPGATLWRLVPGLHPSLGRLLADGAAMPVVAREIELSYPTAAGGPALHGAVSGRGTREKSRRFAVILADVTREKQTRSG